LPDPIRLEQRSDKKHIGNNTESHAVADQMEKLSVGSEGFARPGLGCGIRVRQIHFTHSARDIGRVGRSHEPIESNDEQNQCASKRDKAYNNEKH
jgi:hypothetical protein